MKTINLDRMKTVEEFRTAVQAENQNREPFVVFSGGEMLFTAVSPEVAKEVIAQRIVDKITRNPALLLDIQKRLEEEEPEDWE